MQGLVSGMNMLTGLTLASGQQLDGSFLLPPQNSSVAPEIDWTWNVILWVCLFFFVIVVGAMTLFVVKYRRRDVNDQTPEITHNTPLEIIWSVLPLLLVMWFFWVGFKAWISYDTPPGDSYVIDVEAQKWNFSFSYPNGGISNVLYVPEGRDIQLNLRSDDVLHAFYIPSFRVQRGVVPGRTTSLWFKATQQTDPDSYSKPELGFPIFCTQYCGNGHSQMLSHVVVLNQANFDKKLAELANIFKKSLPNGSTEWLAYKDVGEQLYKTSGCTQCHTVDGSKNQGPTWKGLWKRDHSFSSTDVPGYTLKASDDDAKWEAYIHESVIYPEKKIVAGFQNIMPSFASNFSGTPYKDEKLKAIIEYMKSIGTEPYDPCKAPLFPENPAAKAAASQPK